MLETLPFWFLGKVSYTLYLIHLLVIQWLQYETHQAFVENGVDYDLGVLYVFLIYTPVLLLVSWGLEVAFDTPGKNLAYALDVHLRFEDPSKKKKVPIEEYDEDQDERTCGKFLYEQWFVWVFVVYLLVALYATESYGSVDGNEDRIRQMANSTAGLEAKS